MRPSPSLVWQSVYFFWLSFSSVWVLVPKPEQPILSNHKKHVEQGLECDSCHRFYKTQTFSGMPNITICLDCHKEPITKSPEEEKIRRFLKRGRKSLGKEFMESPIMSSFLIGVMSYWERYRARPAMEILVRSKSLLPSHG